MLTLSTLLSDGSVLVQFVSASEEQSGPSFHRERLQTLGMLAGGVAHDFNNVLAGILGHITYLRAVLPPEGNHAESLQAIQDGALKASSMTQQILNFSKLDSSEQPVQVDLCGVVRDTTRLLKGATPPKCVISASVPDVPLITLGVESRLAQILVNLVINARDAIGERGAIIIRLDRCNDAEVLRRAFQAEEFSAAEYLHLSVADDGHGMDAQVVRKAFEPYFSTKAEKGTGVGLWTVKAIVEEVGGAIWIDSELGVGTTVHALFPAVCALDTDLSAEDTKDSSSPLPQGTESILIVDDEYPVRNVLAMSLEHLGYSVTTVGGGREALELFTEDPRAYDLVILDMLMPEYSGEEVFRRMKQIDPQVAVLVISGYTSEDAVEEILRNGGRGFIQKPFTIEELSIKVRNCLPGDSGGSAHEKSPPGR